MRKIIILFITIGFWSCSEKAIEPDYILLADQKHNKFSKLIPPAITVPSGSVIQAVTSEASDGQLHKHAVLNDLVNIDFGPIHPLTGPVFVEEAEVGDVLAVDVLKIELHDYGWQAIVGGFGFLSDRFPNPKLNIHEIDKVNKTMKFNNNVTIPLKPFAGVMGVAPDTEEMLSTIPPRENGGNMDDPSIVVGSTVYFPVLVKGGLFSIGDTHAVQGLGEVCGTALEAPMTITYRLRVLKDKPSIQEPQYETDEYYAVTGFGSTIDIATKKAVNFMVDYLIANYDISAEDAYMLCSLVGDLKIAEVVDVPNMLVTMHFPKSILNQL
ncbi:MAG: acetamidase/formamidase family protein [Candidatus Marinimicrobia bacterium]|nr:acetamidase/formamidase family protein [Candidatus Neomarinimicrobiota bacterium]MBL7047659.1 acetamidase/formamidase family protein [Candidatus Neomarinimicrobiota bacterium]